MVASETRPEPKKGAGKFALPALRLTAYNFAIGGRPSDEKAADPDKFDKCGWLPVEEARWEGAFGLSL